MNIFIYISKQCAHRCLSKYFNQSMDKTEETYLSTLFAKLAYAFEFSRHLDEHTTTKWISNLKRWFRANVIQDTDHNSALEIIQSIAKLQIGDDPFNNIIAILRIVGRWPYAVNRDTDYHQALRSVILALAEKENVSFDLFQLIAQCDAPQSLSKEESHPLPQALHILHTLDMDTEAKLMLNAYVFNTSTTTIDSQQHIERTLRLVDYQEKMIIDADIINGVQQPTIGSLKAILKHHFDSDRSVSIPFAQWMLDGLHLHCDDNDTIRRLLNIESTDELLNRDILHCIKRIIANQLSPFLLTRDAESDRNDCANEVEIDTASTISSSSNDDDVITIEDNAETMTAPATPITLDEIDVILRTRYRCYRIGQKKGKTMEKNHPKHPDWKEPAWKARNWWKHFLQKYPRTAYLNHIDEILRCALITSSLSTADTNMKHISILLSTFDDKEKVVYFGSQVHFDECKKSLNMTWTDVKTANTNTRLNQEFTLNEINIPNWSILREKAQKYIDANAAPLHITSHNHFTLVRRLYGLRVTILEHEPRRRDIYKVTPHYLLPDDLSKVNYVDQESVLRLNTYKTSGHYGEYAMQLTPETQRLVYLLERWAETIKSTNLFGPLSDLSNILFDIYEPALGCKLGCNILRRKCISYLKDSGKLDSLRDQLELSRRMGQSVWMQQFYYAKRQHLPQEHYEEPEEEIEEETEAEFEEETEEDQCQDNPKKRTSDRDLPRPPAKRRIYPTQDQRDAITEIIQNELKNRQPRIRWKEWIQRYPPLKDVPYDTVKDWGKTIKKDLR